ncbi:MAG TPA: multicopper oxidase domain-containing protein, partial [Thermoanaerobaculia bacterium]|nr:multicopper oxidase domain-containing protein [Thermoanaerobaculia bacterium]
MNRKHAGLVATVIGALLLLQPASAQAQAGTGTGGGKKVAATTPPPAQTGKQIPCPSQQELIRTPELVSSNGRLRATLGVTSQLVRMPFRYPLKDSAGNSPQPGSPPPTFIACYEQWVRAFFSPDAIPAYPGPKEGVAYVDPMVGPTLRAKVGDVIELAFLNTIDPSNFGKSIDRGDSKDCDQSFGSGGQIYPGADKYPNCFHGSTTANLHFHGTHTNPNTTGDNVFLEIVSYKRLKDEPIPTPGSFRGALFDNFFNQCEARLLQTTHGQYPSSWDDLPSLWTKEQKRLLMKYDELPGIGKKLWPVNERQLKQGAWPQYYFGAFPYCFRLPQYVEPPAGATADTSTTTAGAVTPVAHSHGAGSAELGAVTDFDEGAPSPALIMGQSPGTHWYHAHKHGSTALDVSNGMVGAFIIEGGYDEAISKYYDPTAKQPSVAWTRKQPVLVINQIGVSSNLQTGGPGTGQDKGPDFSVNGRQNPIMTMQPGEVKMWRIVNASSRAGAYFIGPPKGFHWKWIARDGVQLHPANWEDPKNMDLPFLLAAGNRADLLVQAPSYPCASAADCTVKVYNMVDPSDLLVNAPNPPPPPYQISLFTVNVKGTPIDPPMQIMTEAAPFPSFLWNIEAREVIGTKKIEFSSTPPRAVHKIDGHQFSGEVGKVVLLNTVEEWKVSNASLGIAHPFHIHINPFQVIETFDPNVKLADGSPMYVTSMPTNGATLKTGQCYLDPYAKNPDDWKPCNPPPPPAPYPMWWDVFPIPSGLGA